MSRPLALAACLLLTIVSFSGVASFGLIGPDEPRYAAIGREMAVSGDWVTPRLWGSPWFEKPALLYWLIGAAFRAGFGTEAAPRLPVALLSMAFVLFLFLWARREFNPFVGAAAAALLATGAMWIPYSHAAVTDIPLSVTFAAALFLAAPAVEGRSIPVNAAAALLALSVLAKGLVPLALALPFLWFARHHWRLWLRPSAIAVFAVIAFPWYALCTWRNGPEFLRVFFWEHQFGRFTSDALQHVQPFWFYVPWLLAALFPSILFAGFACGPRLYADRRRRFFLVTLAWGFCFFALSRNKLPGYLLPLIPVACLLIASGIDAARYLWPRALSFVTSGSLLLLPFFIVAGGLLPRALSGNRDWFPIDIVTSLRAAVIMPAVIVAVLASFVLTRERALMMWFALVCCGWIYIEYAALPWLDRSASARALWRDLPEPKGQFCVGPISRAWRYGLNYYSVTPLPDCAPDTQHHAVLPDNDPGSRPVITD